MKTDFLILTFLFLTSCSPILNHATAVAPSSPTTPAVAAAAKKETLPGSHLVIFSKKNLSASITWESVPSEGHKENFILRFWNSSTGSSSGPYVDPNSDIFIQFVMPSMPMMHNASITPIRKTDAKGAPIKGVYEAVDAYFSMSGAWQLIVQLKQGAQVIDQGSYDVPI